MDLDEVCGAYFQSEDQHDGSGALNKDLLKLKIQKGPDSTPLITWNELDELEEFQGPARKVNVENKTRGADVFGNVKTTKENEMVIKVTLESGVLKGYNRKFRLPLPPALQSLLGDTIAIHPSKQQQEIIDKMTVETISGHDILPGGADQAATATIRSKQGHYQGRFSCVVALTGTVQYQTGPCEVEQQDIGNILQQYINSTGKSFPISFINQRTGVAWSMTGICELTWDAEQTVTWGEEQAIKK